MLGLCGAAIAKKVAGYTPPPYIIRFLISLFTLAPFGIITGALSYYAFRYFDYDNCMKNKKLFFQILFVQILIGSITGALDGFNDECYNPAMIGSVALSLIIPSASLVLHRRFKLPSRILLSFIIIIPSFFGMVIATYSYQLYTYYNLGWPTAW